MKVQALILKITFIQNKFDFPVILINQHLKPYGENYIVRCDQKPGITEVFEKVKQQELYPFVLFIPAEKSYSYIYKERLFENWRKKNKLDKEKARCIKLEKILDPNNEKSVWNSYEEAKTLFKTFRPRSILVGNDLLALGVLAAAREHGIKVPQDLSIAGVDNNIFSRISIPALSTIDLRTNEIGTMAAQLYYVIKKNPSAEQEQILTLPSFFSPRGTF